MSDDMIEKYEERLRALAAELRKRQIDAQRDEAERAERERLDLEELTSRQEQELKTIACQAPADCSAEWQNSDDVAEQMSDSERQQLEELQKRIRDRDSEIERIRTMLAFLTSVPASPAVTPPVAETPQPLSYAPPQINITQNFSSVASPYPLPNDLGKDTEEKTEEDKPTEVESTVKETEHVAEETSGVTYRERLTFSESYVLLSPKQKKYCDGLRNYALQRSGAKEYPAKYHLSIGNGQKVVLKLMIKNGIVIARFRLEDERLRKIRRNATSDDVDVKIKESEVPITDDTAYGVAKQMVDLRLVQITEDIELQKQRAAERRKTAKERPSKR